MAFLTGNPFSCTTVMVSLVFPAWLNPPSSPCSLYITAVDSNGTEFYLFLINYFTQDFSACGCVYMGGWGSTDSSPLSHFSIPTKRTVLHTLTQIQTQAAVQIFSTLLIVLQASLCSCLLLVCSLAMLQAYLASTDSPPLLLSFFKSPWHRGWGKLQLRLHGGQPETVFIGKELTRSPLALALNEWGWSEIFQAASRWHQGLSTTLVTRASVLERTKRQLGNCAWKIGNWCSSVFFPTCF